MSIASLFLSGSCHGPEPEDESSVRQPAVAGTFYPGSKDSLVNQLSDYFAPYNGQNQSEQVAAVIVPHAGYVYSGSVAAAAFARINPESRFEHIFLIGPSHHVYMDGASANDRFLYYRTPLGKVPVDVNLCRKLMTDCSYITCNPAAHTEEHCLEVQLPFIQYWFKNTAPIVPIIIGTQSLPVIQKIAKALAPYFNEKNLFVISSDFSHYPSYKDAQKVDSTTAEAIASGSLMTFVDAISANNKLHIPNLATSACGQSAIAALMTLTEGNKAYEYRHILYRNSGDSEVGMKNEVVGYNAFMIVRKAAAYESDFVISEEDKNLLLQIARQSIADHFDSLHQTSYKESELSGTLKMPCGAFVTLNENGRLRGCIGHFGSDKPLYKTVQSMAQAAAFNDPRFYPLKNNELEQVEIEISVLSPLKKIHDISEFKYGKQGIYITKGSRSGTFLPQVAEETHWSKEEFLGHCAQDKAGLSWDGWKDADLYTYEAVVFKEEK